MSEATSELPEPGWYPDPLNAERERWWDGSAWSDHVQAATEYAEEATGYADEAATAAEPVAAGLEASAVPGLTLPDPALADLPVLSLPDLPPPATAAPSSYAPAPAAAVPGLVMPEPGLAEPGLAMPGLTLPEPALTATLAQPQYVPAPQLAPQRPGYAPPQPAPFPPPPAAPAPRAVAQAAPARVASFKMQSVGGRGSTLQAVRAARPSLVMQKRRNIPATVSFLLGLLSIILPVIVIALAAVFAGLSGIHKAEESYPQTGRNMAVLGVALGIISLILTAIAVMVAMADPEIRQWVLSRI